MKTKWTGLALALLSSVAVAQVGELYDANVTDLSNIIDPAKAVKVSDSHWLAFRLPVLEGTRSPCCWKGRWNNMGDTGCSLKSSHQSYGMRSDSPLADNVIVYSEIRQGQVHSLRVVGESCPVEGNDTQVTWIGDVAETAGLDWLEDVVRMETTGRVGDSALFALALHRSDGVSRRLYSLAKDDGGNLSEEAIFWLGEARGEQGFKMLKKLLADLPRGDKRRQINFALAENDTAEAAELLLQISKSDPDPEQRGAAMFWLAQEYPQQAEDWLKEVIKTEKDDDVLEQAVFAISQLPDDSGDQVLLELARSDQTPRHVRRQALFWLANSGNDSTVAALTDLLTR